MRSLTFVALMALANTAPAFARPGDDVGTDPRTEVQKLRDEIAVLRRLRDLDLKTISDRLDRIERLLERAPSRSEFTPAITARRGYIRLENRMGVTGFVTIDGVEYAVPPLATRTLREISAGPISYTLGGQGLATGPETLSRVNAGERLTITILPPG